MDCVAPHPFCLARHIRPGISWPGWRTGDGRAIMLRPSCPCARCIQRVSTLRSNSSPKYRLRNGKRNPLCSPGTRLEAKRWEHLILAKSLMYTCWQMFERSPTGLAPDVVTFNGPNDFSPKVWTHTLLRTVRAHSHTHTHTRLCRSLSTCFAPKQQNLCLCSIS